MCHGRHVVCVIAPYIPHRERTPKLSNVSCQGNDNARGRGVAMRSPHATCFTSCISLCQHGPYPTYMPPFRSILACPISVFTARRSPMCSAPSCNFVKIK